MRALILGVVLAGCRSQPMPPADLAPALDQSVHDVASIDLSRTELASQDLRNADMDLCDLEHPNGSCPPGYTCCAFTCWGGGPENWCYPNPGCPLC